MNEIRFQDRVAIRAHPRIAHRVAFSPSGDMLATASSDAIRLWHPTTGQPIPIHTELASPLVLVGHNNWAYGVAFSPNNRWLVFCLN